MLKNAESIIIITNNLIHSLNHFQESLWNSEIRPTIVQCLNFDIDQFNHLHGSILKIVIIDEC